MRLEEFLKLLQGVTQKSGYHMAKCPAHDDKKASLSVSRGEDGKILLNCHAGCTVENICEALGISVKDLFREPPQATEAAQIVATYDYTDISGNLLAQKLRRSDKSFIWRRKDCSGSWVYNRKGLSLLPYNAANIAHSKGVYLVEGEKDVNTLKRLKKAAISLPDGAGSKWKDSYTEALKGHHVAIIADNDEPGRKFAEMAAGKLLGEAASVRVLDLTKIWAQLPEHGDTTDIIMHFGDTEGMKAIAKLAKETEEWKAGKSSNNLMLIRASDVPYEPPRWLIAPYFQRGKGTLVQADNGTGKTAYTCAIAAHVSTGTPILDIPIETPGDVLILSVEDDLPILRGRIEASGGNLDKCHFMMNAAGLTFNSPEVEEAVKQVNAKLIIFDPFQAFLGANINMDKSNQTRPELAKLFEMCDRNDCACVIVAHTGKNGFEKSPVNMSLGSVDIPAAMRSIVQIIPNPDNEQERIAVHVKCSNAPKGKSIAYSILDRGGIHWNGFSNMTSDDLKTIVKRKEKGIHYEHEPLVQVFNQLVIDRPGGGFWSYSDLKSEGAKILGFPPYTDINDLRSRLDGGLARELQKHDNLIVTHSERGKGNVRGIRIEQYKPPKCYQSKMDIG